MPMPSQPLQVLWPGQCACCRQAGGAFAPAAASTPRISPAPPPRRIAVAASRTTTARLQAYGSGLAQQTYAHQPQLLFGHQEIALRPCLHQYLGTAHSLHALAAENQFFRRIRLRGQLRNTRKQSILFGMEILTTGCESALPIHTRNDVRENSACISSPHRGLHVHAQISLRSTYVTG
jgi:hypothetical protein